MTPRPGYRFAVAPRFHLPIDWTRRLLIGAGVELTDGRLIPCPPWRSPSEEELALLAPATLEPTGASVGYLFQLPTHFRAKWWDVLERGAEGLADGRLPGLDPFARELSEFLAFKGMPLPEGARCDVVVSEPGERFVPWEYLARWGGINLGEEATSVVLLDPVGRGSAAPPVRLLLKPGEGIYLPQVAKALGGYPGAKQEPDVVLLIVGDSGG